MKKLLIALALFCVPVLACGRGSAPGGDASAMPEPPPPLIEPALGPGSQLVDPRADELVRQMSAWLAETKALTIDAEEIYDEVPAHGPRRQLAGTRQVSMRRPDRLAGAEARDHLQD